MKLKFLILLQLFSVCQLSAQLVITPRTQFTISGDQQLTLQNMDLVNNGNFSAGNSSISFTGNASSSISGSGPIQFSELKMNKTGNNSVILKRTIGVTQRILFTSGFLNLNGFNTDLGSTGHLEGEKENSRIIGSNGGEVLFTTSLNAPRDSNPADLGMFITSNQNLGKVIIKRGHQSQNIPGKGFSVLRYYDIISANNSNLNASLRFKYFDGELNGVTKNSLQFFESQNGNSFSGLEFTSKDIFGNLIEKEGINAFGRFTLSNGNIPISDTKTFLAADVFRLWPNPARDIVFINIITTTASQVNIKVFDNKGALLKLQKVSLMQGSNKLSLDIKSLANGVYNLFVSWNNGKDVKTMEIIKQ